MTNRWTACWCWMWAAAVSRRIPSDHSCCALSGVHPSSWHQIAVLDEGGERGVSEALGKAPAGVVLLAEGWALSPPRMKALHERIRARAGRETPMQYLVANVGAGNTPVPPSREELREWERFVDALADPHAEVHAYADAQAAE